MKFIDTNLSDKEDRRWFISCAISILALITPLVLSLFQHKKKELTYQVLAESTIVDLSDSLLQDIEVKYKGQSLSRLNFITIKLTNSGDLPIRPSDFDSPLSISFSRTSVLLRATVIEAIPRAMQIEILESKHNLQINPMLLNASDYFVLQLLIQGNREKIEFLAHIADVSIILETGSPNKILHGNLSELLQLPPAFVIYAALAVSLGICYWVGKRLLLIRIVICCIVSAVFSLLVFPLVFKLQPILGTVSNYAIATIAVAMIWALFTAGTTVALYETLMSKALNVRVIEGEEETRDMKADETADL